MLKNARYRSSRSPYVHVYVLQTDGQTDKVRNWNKTFYVFIVFIFLYFIISFNERVMF